jgi:hypothetical protein
MNPWPFVSAAYGLTFIATIATSLWAWRRARQAEQKAANLLDRD